MASGLQQNQQHPLLSRWRILEHRIVKRSKSRGERIGKTEAGLQAFLALTMIQAFKDMDELRLAEADTKIQYENT
jgi:hypothetical protein